METGLEKGRLKMYTEKEREILEIVLSEVRNRGEASGNTYRGLITEAIERGLLLDYSEHDVIVYFKGGESKVSLRIYIPEGDRIFNDIPLYDVSTKAGFIVNYRNSEIEITPLVETNMVGLMQDGILPKIDRRKMLSLAKFYYEREAKRLEEAYQKVKNYIEYPYPEEG